MWAKNVLGYVHKKQSNNNKAMKSNVYVMYLHGDIIWYPYGPLAILK